MNATGTVYYSALFKYEQQLLNFDYELWIVEKLIYL